MNSQTLTPVERWESMIVRASSGTISLYKPGQLWAEAPPQPEFKGKPVVRFIDGTREALQAIYSGKTN